MLARSLSVLLLLVLFAPTASAQVTITVEGLVGVVPDTDGPLSGQTDPFVRVFVEGTLVGQTATINGTLTPIWTDTFSILLTLDANTTPTATIELQVYDEDLNSDEFIGTATYEYDWVNGATESLTLPFSGALGDGEVGLRVSSQLEPVAGDEESFGSLKSRYDD